MDTKAESELSSWAQVVSFGSHPRMQEQGIETKERGAEEQRPSQHPHGGQQPYLYVLIHTEHASPTCPCRVRSELIPWETNSHTKKTCHLDTQLAPVLSCWSLLGCPHWVMYPSEEP